MPLAAFMNGLLSPTVLSLDRLILDTSSVIAKFFERDLSFFLCFTWSRRYWSKSMALCILSMLTIPASQTTFATSKLTFYGAMLDMPVYEYWPVAFAACECWRGCRSWLALRVLELPRLIDELPKPGDLYGWLLYSVSAAWFWVFIWRPRGGRRSVLLMGGCKPPVIVTDLLSFLWAVLIGGLFEGGSPLLSFVVPKVEYRLFCISTFLTWSLNCSTDSTGSMGFLRSP